MSVRQRKGPVRILVTGAAGAGTTTVGRSVAAALGAAFLDADDYFWLPTDPPFTHQRDADRRLSFILEDLDKVSSAVIAGSIVDWGAELEDSISLIVFLTVPASIRVSRLRERELARFGHANPSFLEWAAQYDEGRMAGRSLAKHERWLSARACSILRIDGDISVTESTARVVRVLS
ncbi:MAG TPA: AAA family ATPase [Burkholderiales bacterium]|nr:AAA family ATPase [Burkholderiales bacterium]